jgi:hypothetical protein
MTIKTIGDEVCPYSEPPYAGFTNDHIFPEFLGGRKTIRVCRQCNSTFGHSFEGRTSNQLKRFQVYISHFGLDLSRNSPIWPSALTIGDETYDLMSGPQGCQYRLSRPTVIRDPDGRIVGGKVRSTTEAKKMVKGLVSSGHAKEVKIFEEPGAILEDMKLGNVFSFGPDLFRFATKLVAGLAIAFGQRQLITFSGIPAYLHEKGDWLTSVAYCDVSAVLKVRPPLTHTVYLEMGQPSYAIVLFFGSQKIFVPFPASSTRSGVLATLDPLTGEERFTEISPLSRLLSTEASSSLISRKCWIRLLGRLFYEVPQNRPISG